MAHLTSVHAADDPRIAVRECATLRDAGYVVTLVAPMTEGRRPLDSLPTVLVMRSPSRLRRMLTTPWLVFWAGLRTRANIVHLHDPELIPIGIALKALGKRVIYDVHESLPHQVMGKAYLPRRIRPLMAKLAAAVERLGALVFDMVIVANPSSMKRFRGRRARLVQNFPALAEFPTPGDITTTDPIAVYVGGINVERGVWEMVEAMSRVARSDARLIIAGVAAPEVLEEASRRPGSDRVIWTGWQDRHAVQELLRSARVGLAVLHPLPNYLDNYPTKLFEYMAAGIPSIVSDFPLWSGVVNGTQCGVVVNPLDTAAIAAAMDRYFDDVDSAAAAGRQGRLAIETRYNWETEARQLVGAYAELGAQRRPGGL